MTPEEELELIRIRARARARAAAQPQRNDNLVHQATTGVAEGGAGAVSMAGDFRNITSQMLRHAGVPHDWAEAGARLYTAPLTGGASLISPTGEQTNEAIQRVPGVQYAPEPQTTAGRVARTVGQFAPNALIPGGAVTRIARVVAPAIASEAAGEATRGTPYEGVARVGGAIVGGGITEGIIGARNALRAPALAAQQAYQEQAPIRELEQEFGSMTAGERSGNARAMQREAALRRAGPEEAQTELHNFDNDRAAQIGDNLMRRVATRGLEPQNPDLGSTGTTLADSLRSQVEAMQTERAARYASALKIAGAERIAPTDELINTVRNTSAEHFGNSDNGAMRVIEQLNDEIQRGQATYARVERARQALNEELGDAMRAPGNGRQVVAIHRIIDDLDGFAQSRISPQAQNALREARSYSREMSEMYGQQLRPELSTGHTGRSDPGGRAIRDIIDTNLTGEQVIDRIFGSTTRPPRSTLSAVQRIKENATSQISTGGYEAPTGAQGRNVRAPGRRTMRGGRSTRGGRQFDPTPAQEARHGAELPRDDLQALREAFVYRIQRPLTARGQGASIPARTMATQLRQALHGPGAEITRIIFNEKELAAMERALRFLDRISQPTGSYSPSAPGIAQDMAERSMAALAGRLLGKISPGIGQAIENGVVNARAIKDARAAVARPTAPPAVAPLRPSRPGATMAMSGAIGAQYLNDEPRRRLGEIPQ